MALSDNSIFCLWFTSWVWVCGGVTRAGATAVNENSCTVVFNIGVEIGQLLFIAAVMAVSLLAIKLIPAVGKSQAMITQLSIYVIGSCSAYWLFERTILLL